jgi:hypothetical protein
MRNILKASINQTYSRSNQLSSVAFLLIVIVIAIGNIMQGERPTVSSAENRNLAAFPDFSVESIANGSYFSEIDLFVSDTFWQRESLIGISKSLEGWKSIYTYFGSGEDFQIVNTAIAGDEAEKTPVSESTSEPQKIAVELPAVTGHTLIFEDMAVYATMYEEQAAKNYIMAVEALSGIFEDSDIVLDIILAPTRYATLSNPKLDEMFVSERFIISNIYDNIQGNIRCIDVYDNILAHKEEDIYYNSDHHWTSRGAYYAYQTYAKAMGFLPIELSDCDIMDNGDFVGNMYSMTKDENVKKMTDRMLIYVPAADSEYEFWAYDNDSNQMLHWKSMFTNARSYTAFLGGDHADSWIKTDSHTGRNIIVIKDSYGNAFIPYLSKHFDNGRAHPRFKQIVVLHICHNTFNRLQ